MKKWIKITLIAAAVFFSLLAALIFKPSDRSVSG